VKETILIVEDDENLADRVADLLEFEGYAVHKAVNGREGLAMLGQVKPGLVILDMNMPFVVYDDAGVERTEEDIMGRDTMIKAVVRSNDAAELLAAVGKVV